MSEVDSGTTSGTTDPPLELLPPTTMVVFPPLLPRFPSTHPLIGTISGVNIFLVEFLSDIKNAKITIRSTIITKPIIFDRIHEFDFIIQ